MNKQHTLFWNQILNLSDQSDDANPEEISARLLTIEEGFSDVFDPVDAFPEYATILLCKHFARVLEKEAGVKRGGRAALRQLDTGAT